MAAARLVFGKHRHEGLGERAFAEDPAQKIRDAERDVKGIRRDPGAGADQTGKNNVPRQAADAGHQGHAACHQGRFKEFARHAMPEPFSGPG